MAGKLNRLVVSVIMVSALLMTLTPTMAEDVIAGTRTISSTTAVPGETVTATVEIVMLSTVYGLIIEEDIPEGWGITVVDNGGSTYKSVGTNWLFSGVQDGTRRVVYDVEIPSNAAEGEYYITGTTQAAVGNDITGPYQTAGDSVITVVSAGNSLGGAVDVGNPSVGIISIDVNDSEENNLAIGAQEADVADPVETGTFEDANPDQTSNHPSTESSSAVPFINPLPIIIIAVTVYYLRRRQ